MTKKKAKKEEPLTEQKAAGATVEAEAEVKAAEEKDFAKELEETRQQLAECQDRMLRMAADFDNSKKRLEREREITLKYAEENILRELLTSLDNLERAMEQGRETENIASLVEGVDMTWKGLLAMLEKFGLKPINSIGEVFDPNYHEAVAMEAHEDRPANMVLREFQKGYVYKDRLLRAAKVIVSSGPATNAE